MSPPEDGPPSKKTGSGGVWIPIAFLGGLLLLAFGMFEIVTRLTESDFDAVGHLVAKGTAHGDITLSGGTCLVGERFDYDGVYLKGKPSGGVRIIQQPGGNLVRIEVPGTCDEDRITCQYIDVPRSSCSVFEAFVERTSHSHNRRRVWRGQLKLSCKLDKGTVEGDFSFAKCV